MEEKISVIVPAYNIESYLSSTLDSILAQTYPNLEVIVVDDGSKDGTGKLIDVYAQKDSRIHAIHKANGGVTSARLRGVAEASGEWIGFVDGDDFIEPDMYAHLMENAKKYRADISHCGYQMVFPSRVDFYHNTGKIVEQKGLQGCLDLVQGKHVEPSLWNKLYRKELFDGLEDWMDQSIKINEDLLMNYYLFKKSAHSVFEDICPYHYILRKGSAATSRLNNHKLRDPIKVTRLIQKDDLPEVESAVFVRLIRQLISGSTMPLNDQKDLIAPYRKECRCELRKNLKKILNGNQCGTKLKIMALWAAIWPWSYAMVHQIYARATGLDKIYEVK